MNIAKYHFATVELTCANCESPLANDHGSQFFEPIELYGRRLVHCGECGRENVIPVTIRRWSADG